jgi:hypothetical protein
MSEAISGLICQIDRPVPDFAALIRATSCRPLVPAAIGRE